MDFNNHATKQIKPNILETITDANEIKNRYLNLIKSATTEIMLIIPTPNAIHLQNDIGILQLLKDLTSANNNSSENIHIRILISHINDHYFAEEQESQNTLLSFSLSSPHVHFRRIETDSTTESTIIIIDRKESLVIEVKDDSKDTFIDSIGFATYSNSRSTVLSYSSIFESFWKQSDLLKKLKESEELQKDFIHIAAHELKNPIQPILGLSNQLIKYKPTHEKEFQKIVKIINRNAKKLIRLTNDILDVTKIETKNLKLNKELFNLNDLSSNIIEDYRNQLDKKNLKLTSRRIYHNKKGETANKRDTEEEEGKINNVSILADRTRINQVISNLLNNAIKFTDEGNMDLVIEKQGSENKVFIIIKDTGCGIDPSILPKLFSKFVIKSEEGGGTGLGLYISKNIIEAHGGKIWAANNNHGKGATFSFILLVVNC